MRGFHRFWLAVISFLAFSILFSETLRKRIISISLPSKLIPAADPVSSAPLPKHPNVTLVVASLKDENTTWLEDPYFTDWRVRIYVVDDPNAALTLPYNKGREGSVYLNYIIDNYETLDGVVIFSHASRYQWHNDDPLYDGLQLLLRLRVAHVQTQGYVNLRCVWTLGCPSEIHPFIDALSPPPFSDPSSKDALAGSFYKQAYEELFPGQPVPEVVAQPCCAQFAVTAERIKARPKSDYEHYRDWLRDTPLTDYLSGRIVEYMWHIIFGQEAVHCPNAKQCYCNMYGLCDLPCENEGECRSVYKLPKYSTLPAFWPEVDWNGEFRNVTELRAQIEADKKPLS